MKNIEQRLVFISLISIVLVISPNISFEPNALPKFLFLVPLSLIAGSFLITRKSSIKIKLFKIPLLLVISFVTSSLISFVLSSQSSWKQLFGIQGRHLGLITYLCFIIFFLFSMFHSSLNLINTAMNAIRISGLISALLGIAQILGFNIYQGNNLQYGLGVGFLGNPNFQSALLGMSIVTCVSLLFDSTKNKFYLFLQIILTLVSLYGANSTQGYALLIIGTFVVITLQLYVRDFKKSLAAFLITGVGIFSFSLSAYLGRGPLAQYLYQDSTTYRGDYWRAAKSMILDNRFFGLGFDSYRDNYRLYRDELATDRRGPAVTADSPHNTILDAGVNGGMTLLTINLLIILFIIYGFIKYIQRNKVQNPIVFGLFATWVAYLAQAIISIGNIAISLWGWVMGGLLVGLEISSKNNLGFDFNKARVNNNNFYKITGGALAGMFISGSYFAYDANFASAFKSGNVKEIVSKVQSWPSDGYKIAMIVEILNKNNFPIDALNLARSSVEENSGVFEFWKAYYEIPGISPEEKNKILIKLRELDPNNKTLLIP
jgi:O-antigen ligase